MSKDRKILYITSFATLAALLSLLFLKTRESDIFAAIVLAVFTPIVWFAIRKRTSSEIAKREVLILSVIMAVIIASLTQFSGVFLGFRKNPYFVDLDILLKTILPLIVIVITTEIIRLVLLSQKNGVIDVIAFLICLCADVLATTSIPNVTTFNRFMDLVGLALFPALVSNVFHHYVTKHYGMLPNIAFRLLMTLYVYFIPRVTAMPDALTSCIKLFTPVLMLAIVYIFFSKRKKKAVQRGKKISVVGTTLALLATLSVTMLISCRFQYGAIVIATESMTGEINKGDMIIYERYEDQEIKEGQVIVFLKNNRRIVHRVVEIEYVGGETRYYTKGDANDGLDSGYRVEEDLFGVTDMKIAYIGYPSLWLREMLESIN
jgi:signal peptidase I